MPTLSISPETVCYLIVKAREFDVKVPPPDEGEEASNASDDGEVDILEDRADDPTYLELTEALGALNEDERLDLLALMLLGRGDFEEFDEAREQAEEIETATWQSYLLGTPLLGDYLEEGLAALDISCEDFEINRL
jgi:hypothetical protein